MKFPLNIFDVLTWYLLRNLEAFKLVIKEYLHVTTDRLFYSDLLNDRLIIFLFERHLTLSRFKKYVISDIFRWWIFKNSYILQLVLLCCFFPIRLPIKYTGIISGTLLFKDSGKKAARIRFST